MISIIIPTFNSEKTLRKAIQSVVDQTYPQWEIVIVDGQSADTTVDIIRTFAENEPRIRWISEPDQGLYDAMNKGTDMASGKWVYFMGSDDWLFSEDTLESISPHLEHSEAQIIRGRVQLSNGKTTAIQPINIEKIIFGDFRHQALIYKRSIVQKFPFNTNYISAADQAQFFQMIAFKVSTQSTNTIIAHFSSFGFSSNAVDLCYSREKKKLLFSLFKESIPKKILYKALRREALTQITHDNLFLGVWWLYKGRILFRNWRDVLYCVKTRTLKFLRKSQ